jgi:hypothetical protein
MDIENGARFYGKRLAMAAYSNALTLHMIYAQYTTMEKRDIFILLEGQARPGQVLIQSE